MDALFQDLRYAVRALVKHPGFAALTIACLSLGIGVNSTIFSVVDTVAIRPLPFTDPDRLVSAGSFKVGAGSGSDLNGLSYLDLHNWRGRTRSFEQLAGLSYRNFALSDGREAERFDGAVVSANLFPMLGIQPILGRQFRGDEDRLGAPDVVLIS